MSRGYMEVTHSPHPSTLTPRAIFKPKEQWGSVYSFLAADNWDQGQEHPRVTLLALYVSDNIRRAQAYFIKGVTVIMIHFCVLFNQLRYVKNMFQQVPWHSMKFEYLNSCHLALLCVFSLTFPSYSYQHRNRCNWIVLKVKSHSVVPCCPGKTTDLR